MIRRQNPRGSLIKPCPCTPGAVGCGLANANLLSGCPYRCSYCILQEYLSSMAPVFQRGWKKLETELAAVDPQTPLRLTSGELADSLAWEQLQPTATRILKTLQRFPHVAFEFKTKSDRVGGLLAWKKPLPQVVVSWSLAPQALIGIEEKGAPSLQRRLRAMSAISARGYRIGVHFDPLILFPDWRAEYRRLIKAVAAVVPAGRIAWWSLGGLRFNPALRPHIFKRRRTFLFWGELVPGFDGKYRYFKPLRLELFRFIASEIRRHVSSEVPLYLCMEEEEAWREILPHLPADPEKINAYLYRSLRRD